MNVVNQFAFLPEKRFDEPPAGTPRDDDQSPFDCPELRKQVREAQASRKLTNAFSRWLAEIPFLLGPALPDENAGGKKTAPRSTLNLYAVSR